MTGAMYMAAVFLMATAVVQATLQPIDLGGAGDFAILTKTGVTTTGATAVTGDIGASPIAAGALTGFSLTRSGSFSTSGLVTGEVYAANYDVPTPDKLITAIGDMETAYTNATGRVNPDALDLGAGGIEGLTLAPGLYKWGTGVGFATLTFNGTADDVWILQISGDLTVRAGAITTLAGGAQAKNIFWQVAGLTTLHTTAAMEGIILCMTGIDFLAGSSLNGAALSQTAVTLIATTIVKSTGSLV